MKHLTLVAAAVASLAAGPAFASAASSFASASLSPITMTLIDITPFDGIDPYITFNDTDPYTGVDTTAFASVAQNSQLQLSSQSSALPWGNVSAGVSDTLVSAKASLSGSLFNGGVTLSASGSANSAFSLSPQISSFGASVDAPNTKGTFSLSANTVVIFKALSATFVSLGGPNSAYANNWASASTYIGVSGVGAGGNGDQSSSASGEANAYYIFNNEDFESKEMVVTFSNLTNGELSGLLKTNVAVVGDAYNIAAVPEPETYAMLLAGLGLMGAMARRRSKKS